MDQAHGDSDEPNTNAPTSTSTSLHGGDASSEWNAIGRLSELNEKLDGIRSLREFTTSETRSSHDGGLNREDDVLFFSKIDAQYIPGVIADKKRDKLTKDYVYKIRKVHKKAPDVAHELAGKQRSAKEDPRVEIIKLRTQRAKKQATIVWNAKQPRQSYYKIISANDYQIELQLALLRLLKDRVEAVMAKQESSDTILRKTFFATMIGAVLFIGAVSIFVLA